MTSRFSGAGLHWSRAGSRVGVLVLAGSSGRLDVERANLLAKAGFDALALRWFGGTNQQTQPRRVPLETSTDALDLLAQEHDRLVIMGASFGAEAALLTATRNPRVEVVIAIAPTDVAWEGSRARPNAPPVSKWTWRDTEVFFCSVR